MLKFEFLFFLIMQVQAKQVYLVFFGATAGQRIREKFANMQATYTAWLIQGNLCCSTKSPTYFQSFIRWLNLKFKYLVYH